MFNFVRANTSTANTSQPDGGELEDCALIRLTSLSAINQWHDVPCALNDVKQYICKWPIGVDERKYKCAYILNCHFLSIPNNSIISQSSTIILNEYSVLSEFNMLIYYIINMFLKLDSSTVGKGTLTKVQLAFCNYHI